ncbi:unnamed protein product, partial [Adineta ricciae]
MAITSDSRKYNQLHQRIRYTARRKANSYFGKDSEDKKRQSPRSQIKRQLIVFDIDEFKDEIDHDYDYEHDLNEYEDWQETRDFIDAQWREIYNAVDFDKADLLDCLLPPVNIFNSEEIYWTNEWTFEEYEPPTNILLHAIHIGHTRCVRVLLDKIYTGKLEWDLIYESSDTIQVVLLDACQLGDVDLVQELVENSLVDINAFDLLTIAVEQNNDLLVEYLFSQGCDMHSTYYRYLLHHATRNGYHSIAKTLLKYGADPHIQDSTVRTPLDYAIDKRDIET